MSGVDDIRRNIERHDIHCDFQVQDSLFLANSPKGASKVIREHDARTRVGYDSTLYDAHTIRSVLGSKECCGGVRYSGTFGINAYLYCQAMRDILCESGVTIHERSCVTEIGEGRVKANGFTVRADAVVLCVDQWLPGFGLLPNEVYHIQTFLAASAPLTDSQVSSIFPESRMMVWDSELIYDYFRLTGDNRLLVGGSDVLYAYARKARTVRPTDSPEAACVRSPQVSPHAGRDRVLLAGPHRGEQGLPSPGRAGRRTSNDLLCERRNRTAVGRRAWALHGREDRVGSIRLRRRIRSAPAFCRRAFTPAVHRKTRRIRVVARGREAASVSRPLR